MQMKKSPLQVTKAYYSKAFKAIVQRQHLRNKKVFRIYMLLYCYIYLGGGVILIKQYANKGRKDAYMDKITFPDPCEGPQMRFLQ